MDFSIKCILNTGIIILFLYFGFPWKGISQNTIQTGNWAMFFGQFRLHDNLSIHTEAQLRDYGIFRKSEQLLLRSGINFHNTSFSTISAGYARVLNYSEDGDLLPGPSVTENRLWQQYLMRHNIGRIFFEHRYRIEQRWLHSDNHLRYLNRIRYLIRGTIPLNKKELEKSTVFLSFYNETFIHFSDEPFDRNRLFGAIGCYILPNFNIQLGYMAQTVNVSTKYYLQAALFYSPDLRKSN